MNTEISQTTRQWWWAKRLKYNIGLIVAGFIAFLLYCILGEIIIAPHEEFEETIFGIAFQGVAYLFMMGLANIFYTLGWVIDSTFNTGNNQLFRERLFALGYWFSCALPVLFILIVMIIFLSGVNG